MTGREIVKRMLLFQDPDGAGHRPEALAAMCEEFLIVSRQYNPAIGE